MLSFLLLLLLLVPGANDQDGHNHHDHSSMETGESNNDGAWGEWSTEDLAAAQTTFAAVRHRIFFCQEGTPSLSLSLSLSRGPLHRDRQLFYLRGAMDFQ